MSATELRQAPPYKSTEEIYDTVWIIIYKNADNLTTDEFVKKEAFKEEVRDKNFDWGDAIFIPKANYIIEISAQSSSETNTNILKQMLSTFKFL